MDWRKNEKKQDFETNPYLTGLYGKLPDFEPPTKLEQQGDFPGAYENPSLHDYPSLYQPSSSGISQQTSILSEPVSLPVFKSDNTVESPYGYRNSAQKRPQFDCTLPQDESDVSFVINENRSERKFENKFVNPLTNVDRPASPFGEKAKIILIWEKEIPTLEREVTYFDNIEGAIVLKWTNEKFFEAYPLLGVGDHMGILAFPTRGEMHSVQQFNVINEQTVRTIKLKLSHLNTFEKDTTNLQQHPSSDHKLSEMSPEGKQGVIREITRDYTEGNDQAERGQQIKEKENQIKMMLKEIRNLKEENIKLEKQLTEQMIGEEQRLNEEMEYLKHQIEFIQKERKLEDEKYLLQEDELIASKDEIEQLKSHIKSLETADVDKDKEIERMKAELQQQKNANNDLLEEISVKRNKSLGIETENRQLRMENNDLRNGIQQGENEKRKVIYLNQEQGKQIEDLKIALEDSERKLNEKANELTGANTTQNEEVTQQYSFDDYHHYLERIISELEAHKNDLTSRMENEKLKENDTLIEQLETELKNERKISVFYKDLVGKQNEYFKYQKTGQMLIKMMENLGQANLTIIGLEEKMEALEKELGNRANEGEIGKINFDQRVDNNLVIVRKKSGGGGRKVGTSKLSHNPEDYQIQPIPNPTGKSPSKIKYRKENVPVVKLKTISDLTTHTKNQVLCPIKKNYELGILEDIFDVPAKSGRKQFVGIRLNEPKGDSNGIFQGRRFFECEPNHGYFCPLEDVLVPVK